MGNNNSQIPKPRITPLQNSTMTRAKINSFWRSVLYTFPECVNLGHSIMKKYEILKKKKVTKASWKGRNFIRFLSPSNHLSFEARVDNQEQKTIFRFIQSCHRLRYLKINHGWIQKKRELFYLFFALRRLKRLQTLDVSLSYPNWQNNENIIPVQLRIPALQKFGLNIYQISKPDSAPRLGF